MTYLDLLPYVSRIKKDYNLKDGLLSIELLLNFMRESDKIVYDKQSAEVALNELKLIKKRAEESVVMIESLELAYYDLCYDIIIKYLGEDKLDLYENL